MTPPRSPRDVEGLSLSLPTVAKVLWTLAGVAAALVLGLLSLGATNAQARLGTVEAVNAVQDVTLGRVDERLKGIASSLERLEKAAGTKP